MLGEVLVHFGGTGRLADRGVFALGETADAGLGIPRKAAVHLLLHRRLTLGRHPERKELSGCRAGAPLENMNALGKVESVGIGEGDADGRAVLDQAQRGVVIDAAEKRILAGRHFLQAFGLSGGQHGFIFNNPLEPF